MALSQSFSRLITKLPCSITPSVISSLGTNALLKYINQLEYEEKKDCHTMCPGVEKKNQPIAKCKIAIVTGGSAGIGLSIIKHLLIHGARAVVIGDVNEKLGVENMEKLNKEFGEDRVLFKKCDVTCQSDMEELFECTKSRFHKIDIVVNNAGILADCMWEKMIAINICGCIRGTLLGLEYMGSHNCMGNGGTVINVSSILGLQPCYAAPVYTGTKHFLIGYTRSIGNPWFYSRTDVRIMALCPGVTTTFMTDDQNTLNNANYETVGDVGKELSKALGSMPAQDSDECGKCVIHMLKTGQCMDIFVSENCECYKVNIPDRKEWRDKSSDMPKDGHSSGEAKSAKDDCKPLPKKKEEPCKTNKVAASPPAAGNKGNNGPAPDTCPKKKC